MPEQPLFCTLVYQAIFCPAIRSNFRDLDQFVRTLCASAHQQLFLVAPYLSPAGLQSLRNPIATSASRGAWIRILTGDLDNAQGWNRQALSSLVAGDEGYVIRKRLRILTGSATLPGPHTREDSVIGQCRWLSWFREFFTKRDAKKLRARRISGCISRETIGVTFRVSRGPRIYCGLYGSGVRDAVAVGLAKVRIVEAEGVALI